MATQNEVIVKPHATITVNPDEFALPDKPAKHRFEFIDFSEFISSDEENKDAHAE